MTIEEREELNQMICGSSICSEECYYRKKRVNANPWKRDWHSTPLTIDGRLIYDGNIFRCSTMEFCSRITPKTGKLKKYYSEHTDKLKQSLLYKRIKLLKKTPEFTTMILVRNGNNKFWIDVDGQQINPKWFRHSWWTYKWKCEDR